MDILSGVGRVNDIVYQVKAGRPSFLLPPLDKALSLEIG